jgi:hypothetical protein
MKCTVDKQLIEKYRRQTENYLRKICYFRRWVILGKKEPKCQWYKAIREDCFLQSCCENAIVCIRQLPRAMSPLRWCVRDAKCGLLWPLPKPRSTQRGDGATTVSAFTIIRPETWIYLYFLILSQITPLTYFPSKAALRRCRGTPCMNDSPPVQHPRPRGNELCD